MKRFSLRLANQTVEYLAGSEPTGGRGGVTLVYPSSGPMLAASVQPRTEDVTGADGTTYSMTVYKVYLIDDPAGLNGGVGIREADAFRWKGMTLTAKGPALEMTGAAALWRVDCDRTV